MRIGRERPVSITDAEDSADVARRRRERRYALIMVIHLVGLTAGVLLYSTSFWLGISLIVLTGPLPWVAVVLANDGPPRHKRAARPRSGRPGPASLDPGPEEPGPPATR